MKNAAIKQLIKEIPDFPKPGVSFKDISPALKQGFKQTIDAFVQLLTPAEWETIDYLAGIDARGFIFAAALAERLNKGMVMVRKPGKVPGEVIQMRYILEYGETALEIQRGSGNIVLIDDVLATGGTLAAAATLAEQAGYTVKAIAVLMNLTYLNHFDWQGMTARSVVDWV